MGIETERKFLVDHTKWEQLEKPAGIHYRQGYILNSKTETVRVRVSDKQAHLNLKGQATGISRKEYEYEIPLSEGLEILDAFAKSGTEKVRFCINYKGKVWEVDVFKGDNAGLIVAEIELESEDESFEKPDWVTSEVTDDGRYSNASLSTYPFKDWKK